MTTSTTRSQMPLLTLVARNSASLGNLAIRPSNHRTLSTGIFPLKNPRVELPHARNHEKSRSPLTRGVPSNTRVTEYGQRCEKRFSLLLEYGDKYLQVGSDLEVNDNLTCPLMPSFPSFPPLPPLPSHPHSSPPRSLTKRRWQLPTDRVSIHFVAEKHHVQKASGMHSSCTTCYHQITP